MLKTMFKNVKEKAPLVHCITNYVTVTDCANMLIACGGAPIMADDIDDAVDITAICGGLAINIGTLNKNTIPTMFAAGKRANELGHPVILDPVGVGASPLRTNTANELLKEVKFSAIRGNISEIKALALGSGTTKGVDADAADAVTEETLDNVIKLAQGLAEKTGAVIAITGAVDIVADDEKAYVIRNGHPMMSKVTGSGCMLTAMTAAYLTANPEHPLEAAATSICAMGLCGELAYEKLEKIGGGNSSYRNYLIDEVYLLDEGKLEQGAHYEIK